MKRELIGMLYQMRHSAGIKWFFVIYTLACVASYLMSMNLSALQWFVDSVPCLDWFGMAFGVFAALFVGGGFHSGTIQLKIAAGSRRRDILLAHWILFFAVFLILLLIAAGLPALLLFFQNGEWGGLYLYEGQTADGAFFFRLLVSGTVFTLARGALLFFFPFLFRDTVKTMVVSILYARIVADVTQSYGHQYPYRFYKPMTVTATEHMVILLLSAAVLVAVYWITRRVFLKAALK